MPLSVGIVVKDREGGQGRVVAGGGSQGKGLGLAREIISMLSG